MSNRRGLSFINITLILLIISISGIIYYSIYHKGNVSSDYEMVYVESTDEYKVYYYNQISLDYILNNSALDVSDVRIGD